MKLVYTILFLLSLSNCLTLYKLHTMSIDHKDMVVSYDDLVDRYEQLYSAYEYISEQIDMFNEE